MHVKLVQLFMFEFFFSFLLFLSFFLLLFVQKIIFVLIQSGLSGLSEGESIISYFLGHFPFKTVSSPREFSAFVNALWIFLVYE